MVCKNCKRQIDDDSIPIIFSCSQRQTASMYAGGVVPADFFAKFCAWDRKKPGDFLRLFALGSNVWIQLSVEKICSVCFIPVVPISGDFFRRLFCRENISELEPSNAIKYGFQVILFRDRDNKSTITWVIVRVDSLRKCALISVLLYSYGNEKPLHFVFLSAPHPGRDCCIKLLPPLHGIRSRFQIPPRISGCFSCTSGGDR